jgi:hypothetical protein
MKSFKQLRKVNETAGEWGTPELTQKYKDATPGQGGNIVKEASVEDHEASMAFHHDKAQEAKKRGDNDSFEKHMDLKHQHAIARDELNARKKKREAQANLKKAVGEAVEEPTGGLKNACWKGYVAVGTKKKDGKTVPNCVPKEETVNEADYEDEEGDMSRYLLEDIAMMATELSENMEDDDELEAWVQDKITRSHQYLDDVYSYADSEGGDLDMGDETPEGEDEMDYPEVNEAVETDSGEPDTKTKKRLETLVRLGLMDTSDLPALRRAMNKLEADQAITTTAERQVLFDLVETLVGIVTGDDSVFQKVRANVSK